MNQFRIDHNSYFHSLSLLAIVVSGIAIIAAFSNANEKISTGDTLTALSILVTVLIGWNILNYMQLKDSMKKIAQEEVKSVTEDYKAILNGLTMLNGKNAMLAGNFAYLIDNSFDALQKISDCKNEELSRFAIDYVLDFIYEVSRTEDAKIFKGKRNEYIYILEKINHKYKVGIMQFLENAEEEERKDIDKILKIIKKEDIDKMCENILGE